MYPIGKWTCAALLALAGSAAAAERAAQPCDDATLQTLAGLLGQPGWQAPQSGAATPVVAAACKPWPDDPQLQVVAVAYSAAGDKADPGERNLNLLVGQLDTRSGKLVTRFDDSIGEDAMVEIDSSSLWLDTARYRLAPETRGFGLIIGSVARGASCPDAWSYDDFSLYAPQGDQLKEVFRTYLRQWTTLEGQTCSSERTVIERSQITLAMGQESHHGYTDLIISAKVQREAAGEDVGAPKTVRTTVSYDGTRYPFEEFPTFWQSKP
ncbi:PA3715 family protein [Pseudomonas nicosulfuronedens]